MKTWILLLAVMCFSGPAEAEQQPRRKVHAVATFDSGFGGYFTAKEIEKRARGLEARGYGPFKIEHFGDTLNAPYGEKTPAQIASYSAAGILSAFQSGAEDVFLACNTASTQFEAIQDILRRHDPALPGRVHSIIQVSVREIMRTVSAALQQRDTVTVAILATPATVRSEIYPKYLALALKTPYAAPRVERLVQPRWLKAGGANIESLATTTEFRLGPKKRVIVYQLAPGNWVDMIEHGASDAEKSAAVHGDLKALLALLEDPASFDVVGEFCTHYPVFDSLIQEAFRSFKHASAATPFVVQGPLMGALFEKDFVASHAPAAEGQAAGATQPPTIFISGDNEAATRALARKVFPHDPEPVVTKIKF